MASPIPPLLVLSRCIPKAFQRDHIRLIVICIKSRVAASRSKFWVPSPILKYSGRDHNIGPRTFSNIIFTLAYDAISVEITHGSNDKTDIYHVKKEYPCRGELKPLLSKVMASSSSASQDASNRPANVVPPPHPNIHRL